MKYATYVEAKGTLRLVGVTTKFKEAKQTAQTLANQGMNAVVYNEKQLQQIMQKQQTQRQSQRSGFGDRRFGSFIKPRYINK